jgi:hypothetical protein
MSQYVATDDKVEILLKHLIGNSGGVVELTSRVLPEGTGSKHENNPAKNRTQLLLNINLERYRCSNLLDNMLDLELIPLRYPWFT